MEGQHHEAMDDHDPDNVVNPIPLNEIPDQPTTDEYIDAFRMAFPQVDEEGLDR